jgi:NAD(P)-dependent dehydrogenase (short-subunit alcohol dehydrogenase family)
MDDFGLEEKVALVAGGGSRDEGIGNGRGAAILLARAGAKLAVMDKDLEAAELTVAMIKKEGNEATAFACDATEEAECKALIDGVMDTYGRLDCLDNNIGIGSRNSVVDEPLETYRKVMQVNVETMFLLSKYAIPAMISSGDGGSIVNISSISALRPRGLTSYTTSKGAVIALTQAMAIDHGSDGIRVNCVAPGPVYTPMVYSRGMSDGARSARSHASILGVEGSGWDIGQATRFLLSDQARYITGQVLVVDGGVTLRSPERDSAGEIASQIGA